ncbi:glycerophosphodiester phosphodiesterase [Virgibacillus soli]|uniref:Glycerophosphodiester phosphodiesterase n=1 Tax=Paracerasibacillus soli TaxID=480284 RepID=A0ABU5CPT4_9BACI|nr:glycerophosphodiester phosphodiesterase [Virgibacillus soli]MDY0408375.1 glycerophosphodiester phosphodiesterase [Virgibacillus soli]
MIITKVFAHRGASFFAPENTMYAFKLAYDAGADGIETDVQLTKDHIPVLIHDERLNRTTDGKGYVKDYTMQELRKLDAGSWFSDAFTGTSIISLEAFLDWFYNKPLYLNIELKNNKIDYKHLEAIVYEMLTYYKVLDRTIISTFSQKSIQKLQPYRSNIEIAFLTSTRKKHLPLFAKELGADAIHIKYHLITKKLIEQSVKQDIPVRAYTINRTRKMIKCFQYGCQGIFTDLPYKAVQTRKSFKRRMQT